MHLLCLVAAHMSIMTVKAGNDKHMVNFNVKLTLQYPRVGQWQVVDIKLNAQVV